MNLDVLSLIYFNLDVGDILNLKLVCKKTKYILNSRFFWKRYLFRLLGSKIFENIGEFNPLILEDFNDDTSDIIIDILMDYERLLNFDNEYKNGKCLRVITKGMNRGKYCSKEIGKNGFFCDRCLMYVNAQSCLPFFESGKLSIKEYIEHNDMIFGKNIIREVLGLEIINIMKNIKENDL